MNENCCGEVIAGKVQELTIRQKSGRTIELGDLLIERKDGKLFLQVFDLQYGSQISRSTQENISGMRLECIGAGLDFMEPQLRNYVLAQARQVFPLRDGLPHNPKILPNFTGSVRHIKKEDLSFLVKPKNPLYFGKFRTGSKILTDVDVYLEGVDVLSHHILFAATTGRGKSNFIKVMLWNVLDKDFCGILVLDAYNEYFGTAAQGGLRDHHSATKYLKYYSPNTSIPGAIELVINLKSIIPEHFQGIVAFTDAQWEAMSIYYQIHDKNWISKIVCDGSMGNGIDKKTLNVLRRKFKSILGVYFDPTDRQLKCRTGVFSDCKGESTVVQIIDALEECKKVVIDTSMLEDKTELLIGSIIVNNILDNYKGAKEDGTLGKKPVLSIVIEAPRVLGEEVLKSGHNIYSDIAREGRKFKIGLIAITQLTSAIPKTIMANLNTKIILGNELATERNSIIQSASQDLSTDDRNIASLDKGEAIISSNFTKLAVPVKIPLFEDIIRDMKKGPNKKISVVI
jgi:DNA helicase HerA-like ATPase